MTKVPPPNVQPLHPPRDWLALRARAAEQLIRVTDPNRAAGELFDLIAADLRLNVMLFYSISPRGRLQLRAHRGLDQEQAAAIDTSVSATIGEAPLLGHVPDVQGSADPRTEAIKNIGVTGYAAMPLMGGGRQMGVLGFGRCWTDGLDEDELGFLEAVSGYFAAALERVQSDAARRESEEQLRLAMDTAGFGVFDYDLLARERHWSRELREIYGMTPDQHVTLGMVVDLTHPADRQRVSDAIAEGRAKTEAGERIQYFNEYRIIRPDGELRWVQVRGQTVCHDEDGSSKPARFVGIVQDITGRKLAEDRIRESEHRLQLAQEYGGVASWDWQLAADEIWVSESYCRIFGLPDNLPISRQQFERLVHPDDRDRLQQANRSILNAPDYRMEFRIVRPIDQEVRWIQSLGGVFHDGSGGSPRLMGISLDITDRKRDQERERMLTREVDHRAKNLLNVVQSMVQLTRADSMPAFVEEVVGRIHALARVHSLIAASRWEGTSLSRLIEEELTPFTAEGERIDADGPMVELKPAAAQNMALIIHELTINAVKYGALSKPGGRVEIRWKLTGTEAPELALTWEESGGPPTCAPSKTGFGTNLIQGSIERHLGGKVRMDWRTEGLKCEIELPARQLV